MAIISGDRSSRLLLPPSIEDYIEKEDPVRVYDAFVESLDLDSLGIQGEETKVGAPSYDPVSMLKLLVYGYSYGVKSARKLQRACQHNLSFIWLIGGLKPNFKTISKFRRENVKPLSKVLSLCSKLCMKLGLIEGNVLFVDSSKFRANANLNNHWDEKRCNKVLKKLDGKIEELLRSCEMIDRKEDLSDPLVILPEELQEATTLKKKVESILEDLKKEEKSSLNTTDRDSVKTKGRQGIHAGYTVEAVMDKKAGLIVHSEALSVSNDHYQFSDQIKKAEQTLGKEAKTVCADGGYWQVNDLEKISERGTQVIVPSRKQSLRGKLKPFDRENFRYDKESDEYICPEGHRLRYNRIVKKDNAIEYKIKDKRFCLRCKHYGTCTKSKHGRFLQRMIKEEYKEELETLYASDQGQEIYNLRKQTAELPFGHIKRNLGSGYFLLRGLEGVNAEMSILSTCFNISRLMNLLGIDRFISSLRIGCTV